MNRREFLKILGGFTAGAALSALPHEVVRDQNPKPHVSDIPLRPRGKEVVNESVWTRERMLTDTQGFMTAVLAKIENWDTLYPGVTKPEPIVGFYARFSTKENMDWVDAFYEGYRRYGERVSKLSDRAIAFVPQTDASALDVGSFQSLTFWWASLERLNNMLFTGKMDNIKLSQFTSNDLDALVTMRVWFGNLKQRTGYETQRVAYVKDGEDLINSSGLMQRIEGVWDKKYQDVITPENKADYEARKKIFISVIGSIRENFPTALTMIQSIEIDSVARSFFEGDSIYLDHTFTIAMEALDKYRVGGDVSDGEGNGAWARRNLDIFVFMLMHELGHRFDVNRTGLHAKATHPQDELDFIEQRLQTIEAAEVLYRGNPDTGESPLTFGEIQSLLINQLYPNCFGIDQLLSQLDVDIFKNECEGVLKPVITYIESLHPTERKKLFEVARLEDFVAGGVAFDTFRVTLFTPTSDKLNNSAFSQIQRTGVLGLADDHYKFHALSSLGRLNSAVLDDMGILAQELQDKLSDAGNIEQEMARDQITSVLLTHKMLYFNAIYRFLDSLHAEGLITPTVHPELFTALQDIQTQYIHQQLLHAMVGPVGEYEPRDANSTLLDSAADQIDLAKQEAANFDQFNQETYGVKVTPRFVKVIDGYVDHLLNCQETMARVMGADLQNPLMQYIELALDAVNDLHLENVASNVVIKTDPSKGG